MVEGTGLAVLSGFLAGCSGGSGNGGGGGGGPVTVEMSSEETFDPAEVTITVGDTVTWENTGGQGHTVTADESELPEGAEYFASGGFDSEEEALDAYQPYDPESGYIGGDETYEHTFETAGTYEYFCIPHDATGKGTVIVEE
jgi:plastocyanin